MKYSNNNFIVGTLLVLCLAVMVLKLNATSPYAVKISTFAGGNGEFNDPQKLALLSNGDVIVSDAKGHSIKRINATSGVVTTIAGNGVAGFSGDGGPAVNSQLNFPYGIAVSTNDEIYIADSRNHRIRKIDVYGNISTVVGTGSNTFSGDGGLATMCTMNTPMDVSLSSSGELYIVDMYNYRVRKVLTNGTIITFAGNGQSDHTGDGGLATDAALSLAYGVRVFKNGEVYISDSHNFKVRKVDVNGIITTVAGTGVASYNGDNILATSANLNHPTDVFLFDTGELVIADTDNYRVRLVMPNGTIITTAGNGTASFSDGEIAEASGMSLVTGFVLVQNGLLVADAGNSRIRLLQSRIYSCYGKSTVDPNVCNGQGACVANNVCKCNDGYGGPTCIPNNYYISTVAGGNGEFKDPQKIARLSNGDVIVSDAADHSVKIIKYGTGIISRLAGNGVAGFSGDGGPAVNSQLNKPYGIAVSANDEIYIADSLNQRIRKIDVYGNISTVVGTGSNTFSGDGGLATMCTMNTPMDVALGSNGELYIVDMYNHRIRKVFTNGTIITVAGNGQSDHTGDGGLATNAALSNAYGVRVFNNEIYISDSNNYKVRKVDVNGIITTIAGTGSPSFNGDNLLATSSNMNHPADVALLPTGEMLIADTDNYRIRMVLLNGTMVTIAGNGVYGSSGDYGLAQSAGLGLPTGILITQDGILITESSVGGVGGRVRLLSAVNIPPLCNGMTAIDPYVCNGNGKCIGKDICQCNSGWNGTFCSNPQCVSPSTYVNTPCNGNGNCSNGVCTCASNYYGPYCSLSVSLNSRPFTHPIMGVFMMASIYSLAMDGISNVDYTWSQVSGPTISNLATMTNLNTPTFVIPGKFNALSFDNGLVAGNTYGFALTAKITTSTYTTTVTVSTSVVVQQNPVLTFTLQDANTNQAITSGVAGTTVFRLNITSNSNPYSSADLKYGFGFADSNSITILTDMSSGPATFKLPYITGQSSVDIYVGCQGTNSYSIQKLTTISLTNPVSNLTPSQAISTISSLFSSNSSVGDLLGAASLLNTVTTSDSSQISNKQAIRNNIVTSLSNVISTTELGPAIKTLLTVTSVTNEITSVTADNTLNTLTGATNNTQFTRNDVQSLVNIASNVVTQSSYQTISSFSKSVGGKLVTSMALGDLVASASSNYGIAVTRGIPPSFVLGNLTLGLQTNARTFGNFFVGGLSFTSAIVSARNINYSGQRSIKATSYTLGSSIIDIIPMFDNGTTIDTTNVNTTGFIKITVPYSGSLTPVCGLFDVVTKSVSVNTKATLTKQSSSVICSTNVLNGNVLLLTNTVAANSTITPNVSPKKSSVISGTDTLNHINVCVTFILLIVSMLLC